MDSAPLHPEPGPTPPGTERAKIYLAKSLRAVAYGLLSAALLLYLEFDLGFTTLDGLVITSLTLVGSAVASLVGVRPVARRLGTRSGFLLFSALFVASAALLYLSSEPVVVLLAVLVGGVAAASADNGPLASLDQSMLASLTEGGDAGETFARYNLFASFASAAGALLVAVPSALTPTSVPLLPGAPHAWVWLAYLALAVAMLGVYASLAPVGDVSRPKESSHRPPTDPVTRRRIFDLAALFSLDAFAGGLVINPLIAAYFVLAWGADAAAVGEILFVVGAVSGLSFLLASALARRFGLLRTMVATHLPSNVLLAVVPLMPTFGLALAALVARSSLSQMDVPTRQAYSMALVPAADRAPTAATLAGSRGVAQSIGPFPGSALEAAGYLGAPFLIAGALKSGYDLAVYVRFRRVALAGGPRNEATSGPSAPQGSR
ncbi:MAG TPA: hypothetical protein VFF67_07960 [Thermoplasmata archaeon]|nr:hypothetical protein [Thermoplasmata archaeon]